MCLWLGRAAGTERGQAILEYLLLVFIAIILVAGLVYQFNDTARIYFNEYFGSYLGCLIENGILPGVSSDTCPPPSWNSKAGRAIQVAGLAGGAAGGANGGRNGVGGGGSGGGRASEAAGGVIPFSRADAGGGGGAAGGKNGSPTKTGNTGDTGFSSTTSSTFLEDQSGFTSGRSQGFVPYRKGADGDQVQKDNKPVPATLRDMKTARELAAEKLKKVGAQDDGGLFSFGNIFKYLLMLLLLFAIVFFIGSQLFAISRGGRKRE